jgi:hypothetical protein
MPAFEPRNLRSYICSHVFRHERPVLLVAHEDGDWSFLCGGTDHGPDDCHIVGVGHLVDRDASLHACADLPNGFEAERQSVSEAWFRCPIDAAAC